MTDILNTPLICPVLIGREVALATLQSRLDDAISGTGNTLLIHGEAGLGKSRLLRESASYAQGRSARVLIGQSFEPDRTLPYAPFIDLLRALAREESRLDAPETAVAAAVSSLLELLTGLSAHSLGQPRRHDRMQVFAKMWQFIELLLERSPLLIAVEDLHWSDESSLDLFWQLARSLHQVRSILLIGTFRSDEVSPDLDTILTAINRERLATEVRLHPLDQTETRSMLVAMSGSATVVPQALIDSIVALSEGNPFFTEELLRTATEPPSSTGATSSLTTAEIPLPRSVEGTIRGRIRGLSDGARETLVHAAVSGRRFNFSLLEALSDQDEAVLLARTKELVEAQLVLEESADRFAFRHALVRESIYSDLLSRERQVLHREILRWMQESPASDDAEQFADLARHSFNAGAWEEASEYGRIAGERALALYAPHAAIELLGHAITAESNLGRQPDARTLRVRGTAYETIGRFTVAKRDFDMAINSAQFREDIVEECEAVLALGQLWAGRDYQRSGDFFSRAITLARNTDRRDLLATSLNLYGNWLVNTEHPASAFPLHEEALEIFERESDQPGIAATLDLVAIGFYLAGDCERCAVAARRAIPLLRELGDRRRLLSAIGILAVAMRGIDSTTAVLATGEEDASSLVAEAVQIAQDSSWPAGESYSRSLCTSVIANTNLTEAFAQAEESARIAIAIDHDQWQCCAFDGLGKLFLIVEDIDSARSAFERAFRHGESIRSMYWSRTTAAGLARCLLRFGELETAESLIAPMLDHDPKTLSMCQGEIWSVQAQIELQRGRPKRAIAIIDRMIEHRLRGDLRLIDHLPYLAALQGDAFVALGQNNEALRAYDAAIRGAVTNDCWSLVWRTHLSIAAVHRHSNNRAGLDHALESARHAIDKLAATIADRSMREAFHDRVRPFLPETRALTRRKAEKLAAGGLTERERAVAALVSAGRSNREIGDTLFMSERTAATHVSNILSKLELRTRTQIATWVQDGGLPGESTPSEKTT